MKHHFDRSMHPSCQRFRIILFIEICMSATVPPFSQSTLYRLRAETVNLHNIWLTVSARSAYNFTYVNERRERGFNYEITRYDVYRIIYSDCGGAKLFPTYSVTIYSRSYHSPNIRRHACRRYTWCTPRGTQLTRFSTFNRCRYSLTTRGKRWIKCVSRSQRGLHS